MMAIERLTAEDEMMLYFVGARLIEVFPLVQLLGTVSLAVGAMSYAGQFAIMAVADREGYPDLDVFASGVRHELGALTATTLAARKQYETAGGAR
jgi:diacylglycerol O-acyltransferase / wax synthase